MRGGMMLVITPFVASCGNDGIALVVPVDAPVPIDAALLRSLSTVVDDHNHSVTIPDTDIAAPPAGGMVYDSSNNGAHMHHITLTAAQLAAIQAGRR